MRVGGGKIDESLKIEEEVMETETEQSGQKARHTPKFI